MTASSPNLPLELVVEPPMSRRRVVWIAIAGFGLVVGLVLLAAYLGYSGSDRIQDTAQELVRDSLVHSERGAQIEALIVRETQNMLDQLTWVLGLCFALAVGTAGLTVWIIQRAFARLEWQAAELARVSWHLLDGHEKMARRFSHEMHDELGQSLSGLRRMLLHVSESDVDLLRAEGVAIVDDIIQCVRKLSQVLRPVILDDFGLDSGLRWLCERFGQRTRITVNYDSNLSQRLSEQQETHLFRIAQEALTNIARHSEATEVDLQLQLRKNSLRLEITDNGRGIRTEAATHNTTGLGMVGMRARARHLDGELSIENGKERGLRLRVDVPLCRERSDAHQENQSPFG